MRSAIALREAARRPRLPGASSSRSRTTSDFEIFLPRDSSSMSATSGSGNRTVRVFMKFIVLQHWQSCKTSRTVCSGMALLQFAACGGFRVPGGAQKNDHGGKLHPDNQADDGGQSAIDDAVGHTPNVGPKYNVRNPPEQRRYGSARQHVSQAVLFGACDTINYRERHHCQKHCDQRKKDIPPTLQNRMLADFVSNPAAQGLAQNSQNGGAEQRSHGDQQQEQAAELAVQEARFFLIAIDGVDSFHHQFHDLGTRQQRAGPS